MPEQGSTDGVGGPIGLIGGIGLTEVHVYAQRPAPDGLYSGCPHVHAVTDEGYFVLRGRGRVEFHDPERGFRILELGPGDYAHFPPLVMHRLISDGDLVILGMMGNAGLAEAGEARIYFGPEVDADPESFARLVALPRERGLEGALERRDAAVRAYAGLLRRWEEDRRAYAAELERFFGVHCHAMASLRATFEEKVRQGPSAWAAATLERLRGLPGRPAAEGGVFINRAGTESAFGMCGVLRPLLRLEALPGSKAVKASAGRPPA
ncbi:MAG: cupin domain-containing protein [Puniceicoccaceae bacterium]|nr:MAG: cupin domain-containing protein [Puniceicoccaceae bacterium]